MTEHERLRVEADRLGKRVAKLEKALVPFAAEAGEWADTVSSGYRPGMSEPRSKWVVARAVFTIGDCRRAAKLLAKSPASLTTNGEG